MTEIDDISDRLALASAIEALIQELHERFDRRRDVQDVPLHQRGFGVMDEPRA